MTPEAVDIREVTTIIASASRVDTVSFSPVAARCNIRSLYNSSLFSSEMLLIIVFSSCSPIREIAASPFRSDLHISIIFLYPEIIISLPYIECTISDPPCNTAEKCRIYYREIWSHWHGNVSPKETGESHCDDHCIDNLCSGPVLANVIGKMHIFSSID